MLTPYQYAANTPIVAIDLDGLEGALPIPRWWIFDPVLSLPKAPTIPQVPTLPVPPITIYPIPESPVAPDWNVPKEFSRDLMDSEIDWKNAPPHSPDALGEEWEETTSTKNKRPDIHRKFKNKKTGEEIEFDKGQPGRKGWAGKDHWHRVNPNKTGKKDAYLDKDGNPVGKNSHKSHIEAGAFMLPTVIVIPKVQETLKKNTREYRKYKRELRRYERKMKKYKKKLEKYYKNCKNCTA